ncbi:MAG: helix-turn-helix transcriptional regulator [Bacteroidales bacterium]|nr:helix-turn-helix transcriptional regulator [Bacteroidales bacterium]
MLDILSATGYTPHTFSLMTDNPHSTASTLRLQLNKDDMKVSRALQIVSTLGYKLTIDIKEKDPSYQENPGYKLILPKNLQRNLERGFLPKKYRNKCLTFLLEFLSRNNISQRELARRLELSPGAVETWFRNDDLAISHLFRIKDVFDIEIVFTIISKP